MELKEKILKDGSITLDPRVDALAAPIDPRDLDYPVTVPSIVPINKYWLTAPPLDQKAEGSCVGHGLTQALLSEKHCTHISNDILLDDKFAREQIYFRAQQIDEFPGGEYPGANPKAAGTSLTSGIKILQQLGMVTGYECIHTPGFNPRCRL